jgi:hypothetical protein
LPRVSLFSKWSVLTNDDSALARLRDPAFDPHSEVVLAQSPGSPLPGTGTPPGTATITQYLAKQIRVQTQSATPGILILNDRWHPDWKARLDGRSLPLLRANFIMKAVEVPAGSHELEFRFEPPCQTLYVSASAIVAAVGLVGWLGFTGSANSKSESESGKVKETMAARVPATESRRRKRQS